MNKEVIRDWIGRCHSCGEKRIPEQLTQNNGSVCKYCYEKHIASYEADVKAGKHNSPVLFCQDCETQFKIHDVKHTNPFSNYEDFEKAVRIHESVPYKITPLQLTRWKCNCKNKKPILTVGMDYSNWDKGFIERYNKETEEWDNMTEEERDIADGITEKPCENPRSDCFPKEVKKKKQKQHEQKN